MEPIKLGPRPLGYSYNPSTGELLGATRLEYDLQHLQVADEIRFLLPGFTTAIEPPQVDAGQAAVFRDGAWQIVEDHRGEVWYSGAQPVQINSLGAIVGLTKEPPPAEPDENAGIELERSNLRVQLQDVIQQIASYATSGSPIPAGLIAERDTLNNRLTELRKKAAA